MVRAYGSGSSLVRGVDPSNRSLFSQATFDGSTNYRQGDARSSSALCYAAMRGEFRKRDCWPPGGDPLRYAAADRLPGMLAEPVLLIVSTGRASACRRRA